MNLAMLTELPITGLSDNEIVFPRLGIDMHVNSTAFTVFGASITWYGVIITIGMLLAMIYGFSRMRSFGLDSDRAIDGVIGGVIGGIIGARVYYVLFHWDEYAGDLKSVFNIRSGGLAIYGGIIGALLIGSVVCKLRKVRLLPMFDVTSLGFLIGQCIGRWGNFTNHEAFGGNTDNIFGMSSGHIQSWIASNYTDGSVVPDRAVHPCFFYESMWCLLGFILLHIISKKWRKFDGQIFLMYIVWYGLGRFFIEGLRTDSLYIGTVKVSQALALICVVVGTVLLCVGFSRAARMGSDYQLYCDTEESKALLAEADAREKAWAEKRSKKSASSEAEKAAETTHTLLDEADAAALAAEQSTADAAEKAADTAEKTADAAAEAVADAAEKTADAAAEAVADAAEKTADAAAGTVADAAAEAADSAAPKGE